MRPAVTSAALGAGGFAPARCFTSGTVTRTTVPIVSRIASRMNAVISVAGPHREGLHLLPPAPYAAAPRAQPPQGRSVAEQGVRTKARRCARRSADETG